MTSISVILCTHNPRRDYLSRTLEALHRQTLPSPDWELLIIDNASEPPLPNPLDPDSPLRARVIPEPTLGLTQARLKGIAEASADLLVFVDDDNLLAPDYLERALETSRQWPCLGAWSGRVTAEFETQPAPFLEPYLWTLCIREVPSDAWGNGGGPRCTPWGAGLCVRRKVAQKYLEQVQTDAHRRNLDRRGSFLGSNGDIDLALTSLQMGLGTGVFPALTVQHLIPSSRVQPAYLLKLIEDSEVTQTLFSSRHETTRAVRSSRIDRWVNRYKEWRATGFQRQVAQARRRGRQRAATLLAQDSGPA